MNDVPASTVAAPPVGPLFLLSQVGAHAARVFAERLADLGLKPHHAGILRILEHNAGLSQQALSATLGAFASQLVGLVDELERGQLLERRPSLSDRRSHSLHLTPVGRKRARDIERLTRELEASFFAPLSTKDVAQLEGLLRRVAAEHPLAPAVHPAYRELAAGALRRRAKGAK